MSRAHLALVDTSTGEMAGCPRCEEVEIGDVDILQSKLLKAERRIRQLERDRQAEREDDPQRMAIVDLIDHWKIVTGHPKSNAAAADRFDLVKARLKEGYTPEELKLALDGLGHYRYVVNGERRRTGTKAQRHDRMGIALGGGEAVERFANLGHQAKEDG